MVDHVVRERGRVGLEVLDHHKERRQYRDEDVEREKSGLQGSVDRVIATPGSDSRPAQRAGILPVGPVDSALVKLGPALADVRVDPWGHVNG